jgi:hypothetical protein
MLPNTFAMQWGMEGDRDSSADAFLAEIHVQMCVLTVFLAIFSGDHNGSQVFVSIERLI